MTSLAPARIVCVGARLVALDRAGPAVYDRLVREPLPDGVSVIDGGVLGLSMLSLLDGAKRLVFVDQVEGFARQGEVVVLREETLLDGDPPRFGHSAGLAFLIRAIPLTQDGPPPEMLLVGIEGETCEPAIALAASTALRLACFAG